MNPYKILNVSETATDEEIKKAYRDLAKKYHPDLNKDNPDSENKFKELNEAYDKINSQEKRNDLQNRNYNFYSSDFNNEDFSDILNNLRKRQHTYKSRRNTDLYLNYRISLSDVCNGKESDVSYQIIENGKLIDVDFIIKIPKGIEDGTKLCFSGKGNKENIDTPPGDLYVSISIIPDPNFNRLAGLDLSYTATINYLDGLTGGSFDVTLLNGRTVRVKYSPMCGSGTVMKMNECGLEDINGNKGHVFINFNVIPVDLTEEQIELIKIFRVNENI